MNCPMEARQGSELLLEYTAGRLETGAATALEAHMESCARCREFAQSQKMVWQALEAWEAEPVSMDFKRRLFERMAVTPVEPPRESAQVETLGPEQVQSALDDMQMLRDFNHLVRPDSGEPRM